MINMHPYTAVVATAQALPPWKRYVIIHALDLSILYAAHLALTIMYNPSLR